jgi:hypothetical protein
MQVKDGSNGGQGSAKESNKLRNKHDDYLVNWYIGVAKRRGWDVVVHLLGQYPDDEERIKMLIKKKLGK